MICVVHLFTEDSIKFSHNHPDAPCMEYLPTFTHKFKPNVGK